MGKTTHSYHSSADRIAARARLRRIAAAAAEQSGWQREKVLRRLVVDQLKADYADDLPMLSGAVEFELGLHQQDQLRELTGQVNNELCSG